MEKELTKQLEQLLFCCRLCLEKPLGKNQLHSLFPGDLPRQLLRCTGIKAEEDQRLSSVICSKCVQHLTDSYSFLSRCHDSYDFLRTLLADVKFEDGNEFNSDRLAKDEKELYKVENETTSFRDDFSVKVYHDEDFNRDRKITDDVKRNRDQVALISSLCSIKTEPIHSEDDYVDHVDLPESIDSYNDLNKTKNPRKKLTKHFKQKKFSSKNIKVKLKRLKKQKQEQQLLQCDTCNIFVKSYSSMVTHIRTHTGEKPFKCSVCDRCFAQKATLRVHMEGRHPTEEQLKKSNFPCETCGKILKTKKNLKIHLRIHTGETPYECPFCFKRFNQTGTLIIHKRTHTGEKPYVCVTCGKAFVGLNHLKDHQTVHSEDRPFSCSLCDAKFKCQSNLKKHINLHTNEKESVCELCGLSYLTKGSLDSHKRRVHSENSGQCGVCKMTFSNLKHHMVKHTGEKPYYCSICDKRFACIRGFNSHSRHHKSTDKYKCTVEGCDLAFNAEWILKNHVLKHTGELPHSCKVCSKKYVRISDLTKHMRLSHSDAD